MFTWLRAHKTLMAWLGAASLVMVVLGVLLVPVVVARLPSDHFVRTDPRPGSWRARHPVLRLFLHVLHNVLGVLLVLAGIAMLVLPGQGILTILLGLALIDLPGKRRLELAIVRRRPVRRAIEWMRRRAGQPPLEIPPVRCQAPRKEHARTPPDVRDRR